MRLQKFIYATFIFSLFVGQAQALCYPGRESNLYDPTDSSYYECLRREAREQAESYRKLQEQNQQYLNRISQPPQNPYLSQPSLGMYGDSHIFINGEIIQIKKNPERLVQLVKQGEHRRISGLYLPDGYAGIHPEGLENWADNQKSMGDRVRNFFK